MDNYPITWDLDVIYAGGSSSSAFVEELGGMETDIVKLTSELQSAVEPAALAPHTQSKKVTLGSVVCMDGRCSIDSAAASAVRLVRLLPAGAADEGHGRNGLNDRVKTMAAKFNSALTSFDEQLRLRTKRRGRNG